MEFLANLQLVNAFEYVLVLQVIDVLQYALLFFCMILVFQIKTESQREFRRKEEYDLIPTLEDYYFPAE